MKIELPAIAEAERTPLVEALLAVIDAQQQRIQQLEETLGQLKDEIAILQGQKPRPPIAPSRLETPPPQAANRSGRQTPRFRQTLQERLLPHPRRGKDPFPRSAARINLQGL